MIELRTIRRESHLLTTHVVPVVPATGPPGVVSRDCRGEICVGNLQHNNIWEALFGVGCLSMVTTGTNTAAIQQALAFVFQGRPR